MNFVRRIKRVIKQLLITKDPVSAYNILAPIYDSQKANLLMTLDEALFQDLLKSLDLNEKVVLDLGCGTGRHWKKFMERSVKKVIGADSSIKMLEIVKAKYPNAETILSKGSKVKQVNDASVDVLVSTLTIGYIKYIESAFQEWDRLLKENGEVVITDYHPALLHMGGSRNFEYKNKMIAIKNYIHEIDKLRMVAKKLNWQEIQFIEKKIDENLESYYAQHKAQLAYQKYKGTGIVYGLHFRKG